MTTVLMVLLILFCVQGLVKFAVGFLVPYPVRINRIASYYRRDGRVIAVYDSVTLVVMVALVVLLLLTDMQYLSFVTGYNTDVGVACQANAGCVVEGNYFEDVEEPVSNHYAGPGGRCVARNNVFVGESGQPDCSGAVEEPRNYYDYTLDDPNSV